MQGPTARPVTVLPATLQMAGVVELKVTGRPELAVALSIPLPPTTTVGAVPKGMVWLWLTVMLT